MIARMAATARTIPKTYASLAGSGFGAMCPLLAPDRMSPCRTLEGLNGKMCELLHTSLVVQKMQFRSRAPARVSSVDEASVQVTAPGAITSMIAAMSTRPNRQNRGTCSRMSEPLVQKQKLRLVNRINARRGHRPRHDRYDGQRHPDGKYEPSWFRCHLFPSWQTKSLGRVVRAKSAGDV